MSIKVSKENSNLNTNPPTKVVNNTYRVIFEKLKSAMILFLMFILIFHPSSISFARFPIG